MLMFNWLKEKGQEGFINNIKVAVDECGNNLDLSLRYYYKNSFQEAKLKQNKNGIERFYLFMCFAYGYLFKEIKDLGDVGTDGELTNYFIEYIPVRFFLKKINLEISQEVYEGMDVTLNNHNGLVRGFGYAGHIVSSQSCPLSTSAARTGGHMVNNHINKKTIIQADSNYATFRKAGSLYRDGDKIISGLQIVFDNTDIQMHKLKIS